ncbi:MAG: efflux RND transporter permease subunit [Candidatus Aminicenantia bacterium]
MKGVKMDRFYELIIKLRLPVIILTIILTIFLGYKIKDIKINPDLVSYLPKSDSAVKLAEYIGNKFGGNFLAISAIETDDVFTKENIAKINEITSKVKLLEGVEFVVSLTDVLDIKKSEDGIEIGKLIDEYNLPLTQEELKKVKEYALSKERYRNRIVSKDGMTALIITSILKEADRRKVTEEIKKIVLNSNFKGNVYFGGLPFQLNEMSNFIIDDLKLLTPFVALVVIISLYLNFLTIRGVILPLLSVLISTIWTLGLMSIFKVSLTIISDTIPVLLLAIGSAYSIHIVSKFDECKKKGIDMKNSFKEVSISIILAGLTTTAGFISFITGSYLTAIREFGLFSAIGVFTALIVSLTFVTVLLSFLKVKKHSFTENFKILDKLEGVAFWILKREKITILIFAVLLISSIFGISLIHRKSNLVSYFNKDSYIQKSEKVLENKFGGSVPLHILVKGDISDPKVLEEMKNMEEFLNGIRYVSNSYSIVDYIEEMNDLMGEGMKIPDTKEKVQNLLFLIEGEDVVEQLISPEKDEALIQATIKNLDIDEMKQLIKNIDEYISKKNGSDINFSFTGMPLIYSHLDSSLLKSQLSSLSIAIVLVFFCVVFLLRSLSGGLLGLVPIIFTLFIIFGIMGFAGIPLDIATVLVGSVSIGIGIDYPIHFLNRYRAEMKKNISQIEALHSTLTTTGKAIITNMITVALGFLILIFANLIPLRRFGLLVALTMLSSGIGALTFLPALIIISKFKIKNSAGGLDEKD